MSVAYYGIGIINGSSSRAKDDVHYRGQVVRLYRVNDTYFNRYYRVDGKECLTSKFYPRRIAKSGELMARGIPLPKRYKVSITLE
jgi:hypothetical protein